MDTGSCRSGTTSDAAFCPHFRSDFYPESGSMFVRNVANISYLDIVSYSEKNAETFIDASKEVGLEINVDKTKYMLLSRHQNVAQNRDMKIVNR
jgi:hypothetical protein